VDQSWGAGHVRYVPLQQTDAVATDIAQYFSIVTQSHGTSRPVTGLLVLDGDKRVELERSWARLGDRDPRKSRGLTIIWVGGGPGNDFESVFCDKEFLVSFFGARGGTNNDLDNQVQDALAAVKYPGTTRAEKGATAIQKLVDALLLQRPTKVDDLEELSRFYIENADRDFSRGPRAALTDLDTALDSLAG